MIHYQMTVSCFSVRPQRKCMKQIGVEKKKFTNWFVTFLLVNIIDKNNYFNGVYSNFNNP